MLSRIHVHALVLLCASVAYANPGLHGSGGGVPGTYSCADCHVGSAGGASCGAWPCFSPMGAEYRLWGFHGDWDADGDGYNNGSEFAAGSGSAGFPASAENAGCSMLDCA